MTKTLLDETVRDALTYGIYAVHKPSDDSVIYVCNFCGETFKYHGFAINHIMTIHKNDVLPRNPMRNMIEFDIHGD